MAYDTFQQSVIQAWCDQGYAPHDIELWEMLCGYLSVQGGEEMIASLPRVIYPLLLDSPEAIAVREWFAERDALPVFMQPDWIVRLLPRWRSRLRRMQHLMDEGLSSMDWIAFGYLPWYWKLDFCQEETR